MTDISLWVPILGLFGPLVSIMPLDFISAYQPNVKGSSLLILRLFRPRCCCCFITVPVWPIYYYIKIKIKYIKNTQRNEVCICNGLHYKPTVKLIIFWFQIINIIFLVTETFINASDQLIVRIYMHTFLAHYRLLKKKLWITDI